jgi:hypothetical protein
MAARSNNLAAPVVVTYAKLTHMARSTLDRGKNAATQGRRASLPKFSADP